MVISFIQQPLYLILTLSSATFNCYAFCKCLWSFFIYYR